jgi:hypothetical protein
VELTISKARYLRVLARRRLRWRWSPLCLRGQPSVSFDFTSAGTMPSLIWILYCLFSRVTGVQLTNVRCEAEDGKGAADGLSCVVSQGANARSGRRQPWKRCAWPRRAAHRPRPKVARVHKTGLTAATNYVFAYAGDADGSVCADMHAQAGYHDSSLDHVHTIEPRVHSARQPPLPVRAVPAGGQLCVHREEAVCQHSGQVRDRAAHGHAWQPVRRPDPRS